MLDHLFLAGVLHLSQVLTASFVGDIEVQEVSAPKPLDSSGQNACNGAAATGDFWGRRGSFWALRRVNLEKSGGFQLVMGVPELPQSSSI